MLALSVRVLLYRLYTANYPVMALLLDKLNPQHEVEIETPRLRLRAVCASDLHTLHAIRTDPAVMEHMCVLRPSE